MDALVTEARVLVLDSAAGIAWQTLALLHASDYVVLVTTPETPALTDAYAVAKALLTRNPGRALGIVLNRVGSRRAGWETFERLSSVMWQFLRHRPKLLGLVEEDLGIRGSVEAGVPRVLEDPGGAFARSIKEVADNLLLETDTEESRSVEPYSARLCQVIAHRPRAWVRDGS
jgi:flagellar biosynthesis protein FlhG